MPINRLVVVSNRLPIVLSRDDGGGWTVKPGAGGLVTALAPVLRNRGGLWIGWPGTTNPAALSAIRKVEPAGVGYRLEPVMLTEEELEGYYHGFSNEILWPLFHDLPGRCNFDPDYWPVYKQVNRKFADGHRSASRAPTTTSGSRTTT